MVAKDRQSATNSPSPKVEVGEIDTRAPFQSVKDAVTLFGEGAFSGSGEKSYIKKTKPHSAEVFMIPVHFSLVSTPHACDMYIFLFQYRVYFYNLSLNFCYMVFHNFFFLWS